MNRSRVWALLRKELLEILRNRAIVFTFALLAVVFALLPIALAFGLPSLAGQEIVNDPDTAKIGQLLARAYPAFGRLSLTAQFQVFMLRQFVAMFLLVPVMGAMSVATYSIIGEKTTRSLEALLATPIRVPELLAAKTLAAAVPAVVGTWLALGAFAWLISRLGGPLLLPFVLDPPALLLVTLGVPLVALFGLGAGVIVSSRVNDPRSAQQLGGVVVLPIVLLMIGQSAGLFLLSVPAALAGIAVLGIVDAVVLAAGVALFQREAILTRWK